MLKSFFSILSLAAIGIGSFCNPVFAGSADSTLLIKKTTDFAVNGEGTAPNWSAAQWFNIAVQNGPGQKQPGRQFSSRVKILYSDKGMYFLFDNEDKKLTATILKILVRCSRKTLWKFFSGLTPPYPFTWNMKYHHLIMNWLSWYLI